MLTAIVKPNQISAAQKRFTTLIRQALPADINKITIGFPGGSVKDAVLWTNNRIWYSYQLVERRTPRHWNVFGAEQPLREGSNKIAVEINIATTWSGRRVAGLYAIDKTGKIYMLHTGMIGGHHKGKQAAALLESCKSRLVEYIDPTRTNEAFKALRVAKLEKDEFVNGLESFVKDIRKFKEGIDESVLARIPPSTLKKEIDGYVTKPRSVQVVSVAFKRNQYVAEVVRRRAKGKCELCRKSAPFKKNEMEFRIWSVITLFGYHAAVSILLRTQLPSVRTAIGRCT